METVALRLGRLRGREAITVGGCRYYSFQGVPYAKPPVGPLRFKPPQPVEPWWGLRDALQEGPVAPQISALTGQYVGDEDCLYLNIYTTKLPSDGDRSLLPVMFWIHGGGFTTGSGSSDLLGPDYLMPRGVVLVTVNYRLGVLGFMSTGDSVVPGNMGLKDQVLALRWVKDNIAAFGGDPDNVTIFGESAGSIACHLHLISPMSKGLFEKAICQSGVSAPRTFGFSLRERSFRLARHLGLDADSSEQLLRFMTGVPARTLVENLLQARSEEDKLRLEMYPFRPVVEPAGVEAFLSQDAEECFRKGDFQRVPLIMGVNSNEGMYQVKGILSDKAALDAFNRDLEIVVPTNLPVHKDQRADVARSIRSFYFEGQQLSEDTAQRFAELKGDVWFVYPTLRTAKLQTKPPGEQTVFLYHFDVDGRLNLFKNSMKLHQYPGACHADDLLYLFRMKRWPVQPEPDSVEAKTISRMTKLWANFAKTGNPTPVPADPELQVTWPAFKADSGRYLDISNTGLSVREHLLKTRMDFWDSLYK